MSGETGGGLTAEDEQVVRLAHWNACGCRDAKCRTRACAEAVALVLAARLADRDAALARVEALHYTVVTAGHGAWCHHDGQRIPCDTMRALHPDPSPEAHPFAHPHGAETVTGVSVGNTATGEVIGSVQIDPETAQEPGSGWIGA